MTLINGCFLQLRTLKGKLSHTQSPQASWAAGSRWERPWGTGIFTAEFFFLEVLLTVTKLRTVNRRIPGVKIPVPRVSPPSKPDQKGKGATVKILRKYGPFVSK